MTTVGRLTFEIDGLRTRLDQQLQQIRQEALKQPLQYKITVDEGASRRSLDAALKALSGKEAKVKLSLDGQAIQAELTRLKALQTVTITVKMAGQAALQNDVTTLKALLGTLGTNMQYRVTVNTTALSALNSQINTQIIKLQSLITQLRNLGAGPGPTPPGGGAGGGGISAANRALLAELEALNNQWKRGEISAVQFGADLTTLQGKLRTAATAATAGTAEFRALDSGLTRLTMGLRSINTDTFQKIRTDAGAMRAAFDQATAGVERNSAAFSAAQATYSVASAQIIARLQAMQSSGNLTTQQLGQLNRELQRLAREANTINGNINHAGLSGNVVNSFGALGGQFGMIAMQGAAMVAMFRSVAATAGPAAVALTALGGAALMAGGALVGLGAAGLGEVKKLEQGLNILQANGVQDLGAIEDKVKSLQESLGLVGESFSRGDLMLSMADTVKAGVDADAAMTLMASSTRLAAAEQISLNDASALLLKNIRQYNKDVSEAARVGDMLATAGNLAAGTANDLSVGLGIVGGTGFQAKIEMYDLLGMLVELDNKGMSAADVGANGLRAALAALADITKKGQGVLKELGIEFNDAAGKARPAGDIMIDLGAKMRGMGITVDKATGTLSGNGEALRTVASLMDNRAAAAVINLTGDWKKYGDQVEDSNGMLTRYSETMQQGVAPAMNRVKNAFSEAGGEFVKTFADPLASFLTDTLTPLLKDIGSLFEKLQGMKEIGQIKMSVLFEPGDNATGSILSLLGAPVAAGMAIGQQMNVSELQQALQRGGLIEEPGTPGAALAQRKDIERNYAAWLKLAMENDARIRAGAQNPTGPLAGRTATGAPAPLTGEGPLLPGQSRAGASVVVAGNVDGLRGEILGQALLGQTGNRVADEVAGWCARWVKLTLQKANPEASKQIEALFGGASADVVKAKAVKAGLLNRDMSKLRPGDVVLYDDNHIGVYVGKQNGVDMVRGNNQWGVRNGRDVVSTEKMSSLGKVVGFVSVPQALGMERPGAPTNTAPPPAAYTGLTAAQIAQAQALQAAIDKAQKALNANPKDTALIKALDNAKEKAKAWGEQTDTNARALQAVTAAQGGLTKATGDYIATQADLNAHGTKALQLIKAQEAANASGNSARILAADNAVKAWQGESKAKAAVLQVERAAYQTRKQASEEAKRDAERDAADADRRAKEQATQRAAIAKGVREGQAQAAGDALAKLQTLNKMELDSFKGTAAEKLALTRKLTQEEYEAAEKVARIKRNNAIRDAENGPAQLRAQSLANANTAYENTVLSLKADRLSAVRAAQEAATAEQRAWNEALEEGVRAGNEALATLDQYAMGGRDLAATAQPLIPAEKTYAALEDRIISMKGELADPTTLTAWTEVIQGFGEAGRLSAVQVQSLIDLMTELHEGPGAEWAREFADVQARDDLRYGNGEAATDAAMRGSYGVGAEGLAAALKGYGVRSVEELLTINPTAAASIQRVYAGVFAQMNADMEAGAVQSLAILDYYRAEADRIADQTATAADNAVSNKDAQDADLVARYKRLGPGMMLAYLGGAGNDFFGDKFFTQLGETGRAKFLEALDSFTPEDFAQVPESLLNSITAQIGESPEWAALKGKIKSAIKVQVETDSAITTGGNNTAAAEAVKAADELAGNGQYVDALGILEAALTDLWAAAGRGEDAADAIGVVTDAMNRLDKSGGASLKGAADKLAASQRELNAAMGQAEQPYEAQIRGLEELRESIVGAGGATDAIDELIAKWRQLQKETAQSNGTKEAAATFDKLSATIGQAAGIISGAFGEDAGGLTYVIKNAELGAKAFGQFLVGDFVGMAMTTIDWLMNLGNAFEDWIGGSSLKAWKKELLEVAQIQKSALSQSTAGIKSPWQDALEADAAAREKLGNAKWYQRLAWGIFGGAPQAMKTESAKALAEMQTIFAGFAEGFSGILTNTLTDAFNKGDMSNWAENFSKSFDAEVGQLILKTIIKAAFETGAAANDLGELTKAVKEERYGDIPPILTRLKATAGNIGAGIAAIAPSLPGYGAGADDNGTGVPGGSLFGNAPSAQLGIPRFEVSFPEIATRALTDFSAGVPEWRAGVGEFRQAVTEWRAFMAGGGLQTIPARNVL